jgi:hypothetical protein
MYNKQHLASPGNFDHRAPSKKRKYSDRAFCVGIGGPVGSGKNYVYPSNRSHNHAYSSHFYFFVETI